MRFPNAYKGLQKVLISQYLQIISVFCMLVAGVLALVGAEMSNVDLMLAGGGLLLAGAVIAIIGLILNLIGLNQARRDEQNFMFAFIFAIIAIATAVVGTILLTPAPVFADWLQFISKVAEITVTEYTVIGIVTLATQLRREDVAGFGRIIMIIITILFAVVLFAELFANTMTAFADIMGTVSSALNLLVLILFIILLVKSKKMLSKN